MVTQENQVILVGQENQDSQAGLVNPALVVGRAFQDFQVGLGNRDLAGGRASVAGPAHLGFQV